MRYFSGKTKSDREMLKLKHFSSASSRRREIKEEKRRRRRQMMMFWDFFVNVLLVVGWK